MYLNSVQWKRAVPLEATVLAPQCVPETFLTAVSGTFRCATVTQRFVGLDTAATTT